MHMLRLPEPLGLMCPGINSGALHNPIVPSLVVVTGTASRRASASRALSGDDPVESGIQPVVGRPTSHDGVELGEHRCHVGPAQGRSSVFRRLARQCGLQRERSACSARSRDRVMQQSHYGYCSAPPAAADGDGR
jgi:hypothetical protein